MRNNTNHMSKGQNSQSKSTKNPKFNPSDNSIKIALLEKRKQALQNNTTPDSTNK